MTPEQKIKLSILSQSDYAGDLAAITAENLDAIYDEYNEDGALQDLESEFREGEVETKIPTDYSRHFESKSVAAKMGDGTWVGWTYWYGGGKHAEPEAIDWMNHAYELEVTEEEKVVIVRTYKKK